MGKLVTRYDFRCKREAYDRVFHLGIEKAEGDVFNVWYAHGRSGEPFAVCERRNKIPFKTETEARYYLEPMKREKAKIGYKRDEEAAGKKIFPFESRQQEIKQPAKAKAADERQEQGTVAPLEGGKVRKGKKPVKTPELFAEAG